jgi:hypothetical protein
VWLAIGNARASSLVADDPDALEHSRSLGQLINAATRPVHILYVHGMRADGPGAAQTFIRGMCKYASVNCGNENQDAFKRHMLELAVWPSTASVMGRPIWLQEEDWKASQPFVDRYTFHSNSGQLVVVDEVNWWPLLFPIKCRTLVAPESQLSGADKNHLNLCFRNDPPYHAWLSPSEYAAAMAGPTISGGGVWLNRTLKQQILNWGLADAVIAVGPMRTYLRETMEQAFDYAAKSDGQELTGQEFVVVSESLGSFVVMDAAANADGDTPMVQQVIANTSDLYFFANQFALLELARIANLPQSASVTFVPLIRSAPSALSSPSPFEALRGWASPPQALLMHAPVRPKQIIAFSDPSDILTYLVPKLKNSDGSDAAIVVNVFDRNEFNWFGLLVDPVKAHTGHSANTEVLKLIFRR